MAIPDPHRFCGPNSVPRSTFSTLTTPRAGLNELIQRYVKFGSNNVELRARKCYWLMSVVLRTIVLSSYDTKEMQYWEWVVGSISEMDPKVGQAARDLWDEFKAF